MRGLFVTSVWLCVSASAVAGPAWAGSTMPAAMGNDQNTYGGGFVEMLLTGEDPTPEPGVLFNRPPSAAHMQQYRAQQQAAQQQAYQQQAYEQQQAQQAAYAQQMRQQQLQLAQQQAYAQQVAAQQAAQPARVMAAPAPVQQAMVVAPQAQQAAASAPTYMPSMTPVPGLRPELQRQLVSYTGHERPGTIIVDTPSKFLYLIVSPGQALRYGIGVGRPGFEWAGVKTVSRKAEWPEWIPPAEMLQRRPDLPTRMPGGPQNPLGARALYLGSTLYRIHGTNEPATIGQNVSSGCIRMMNEDVMDLYERVPVGAKVIVI